MRKIKWIGLGFGLAVLSYVLVAYVDDVYYELTREVNR